MKSLDVQLPSTEQQIDVISLLTRYVHNELSPESEQMAADLISSCDECKMLYNDLRKFFDEGEALLFELSHKEDVENARQQLYKLAVQLSEQSAKESSEELLLDFDGCPSCGA